MTWLRASHRLDVVVVRPSDGLRRSVEHVLGDSERVHAASDADSAASLLAALPASCVLAEVSGASDRPSLEELLRLRSQFPHVPMVAIHIEGISALDATLRLGRAGVTEVLAGAPDIDRTALAATLSRCHATAIAIQVWDRAALTLPSPMVTLLKVALRIANRPIGVEELARAAGMSARSLRRYCDRDGLPSPQWIAGWARVLTACYFLSGSRRAMSDVASVMGYPSPDALRRQIRRYTGVAAGDLRAAATLGSLGACVLRHVRNHRARPDGGAVGKGA